jgi:polysaccharide deacetylase 2 family uncharacterized protein YibQ
VLAGAALFALGVYVGGWRRPPDAEAEAAAVEPAPAQATPRGRRAVAAPSPRPAPEPPPPPAEGARLAVVIDDLGRSVADLERLGRLGVPLTYAVLPYESVTPHVVAYLRQRGGEILCHLPMAGQNGADPGPGALSLEMRPEELAAATRAALTAVPGAAGVNNHMGSALSADRAAMRAVLGVLAGRGLFYLDSRTTPESVGYQTALELGLAAAERHVFLDADPAPEAIAAQFDRLLALARERGAAIAIGHPNPGTLAVLEREVPRALARGYEFVPVSYLLDRQGEPAE